MVTRPYRRGLERLGSPVIVSAVLLCFAVVIMLATLLILTAMNHMAEHTNALDERHTQQTAAGALAAMDQQMASAISDYTAWDDAARAVYVDDDREWLDENFGVFTGASELFDTYFLISPDGRVVMSYKDGKAEAQTFQSYFGPSAESLLDRLKGDLDSGVHQVTGFLETKDGPAIVGLAAVRSSEDRLTVEPDKAFIVAFARHLTPKVIDRLARTYVIDGLSFVSTPPEAGLYAAITDPQQKMLGALVWTKRDPGSDGYQAVQPLVFGSLIVIGLFFAGMLAFGTLLAAKLRDDERSARQLAREDRLSGLLNREGLFEALKLQVLEARRRQLDVILIYMDLDRFKEVNDVHGHGVGDQLIRGVAVGLATLMPPKAAFARLGGDEFAIAFVCEGTVKSCTKIEAEIAAFFAEPLVIAGKLAAVGASMGIAVSEKGAFGGEELLRRADLAMYRAKSTGDGRAVFYDPSMDADREARVSMAQDLRVALDAGALEVYYQPVTDAQTKEIRGFEALVRWNRNGRGMVPPDIFIGVAEYAGLIGRLGEFVMERAFRQATRWPGLSMAVNVSPVQLHDTDFVARVVAILERCGLEPHRAVIEITEGFFIRNPERARHSISELGRRGVKVVLDDFGSGFSSVGYLREFHFDRMKIDRSLTQALGKQPKAGDTLQATVALAASFGIPVTAEGIETWEQAEFLRKCGCDQLQGYLFSRPLPAEEIEHLLAVQTEKRAARPAG